MEDAARQVSVFKSGTYAGRRGSSLLHAGTNRAAAHFPRACRRYHRRRGYAGRLLRHAIQAARDQGRAGVVLTCKERLLPYYAKFGFVSEGVSASVHGGAVWYQMRLAF